MAEEFLCVFSKNGDNYNAVIQEKDKLPPNLEPGKEFIPGTGTTVADTIPLSIEIKDKDQTIYNALLKSCENDEDKEKKAKKALVYIKAAEALKERYNASGADLSQLETYYNSLISAAQEDVGGEFGAVLAQHLGSIKDGDLADYTRSLTNGDVELDDAAETRVVDNEQPEITSVQKENENVNQFGLETAPGQDININDTNNFDAVYAAYQSTFIEPLPPLPEKTDAKTVAQLLKGGVYDFTKTAGFGKNYRFEGRSFDQDRDLDGVLEEAIVRETYVDKDEPGWTVTNKYRKNTGKPKSLTLTDKNGAILKEALFDKEGRLTSFTDELNHYYEKRDYNRDGSSTITRTKIENGETLSWVDKYDENGQLITSTWTKTDGNGNVTDQYVTTNTDHTLDVTSPDIRGVATHYSYDRDNGRHINTVTSERRLHYEPNTKKYLKSEVNTVQDTAYHPDGKATKSVFYDKNEGGKRTVTFYDSKENDFEKITCRAFDGNLDDKDFKGCAVETHREVTNDGLTTTETKIFTDPTTHAVIGSVVLQNDKPLETTKYDENGKPTSTIRNEYDKHGKLVAQTEITFEGDKKTEVVTTYLEDGKTPETTTTTVYGADNKRIEGTKENPNPKVEYTPREGVTVGNWTTTTYTMRGEKSYVTMNNGSRWTGTYYDANGNVSRRCEYDGTIPETVTQQQKAEPHTVIFYDPSKGKEYADHAISRKQNEDGSVTIMEDYYRNGDASNVYKSTTTTYKDNNPIRCTERNGNATTITEYDGKDPAKAVTSVKKEDGKYQLTTYKDGKPQKTYEFNEQAYTEYLENTAEYKAYRESLGDTQNTDAALALKLAEMAKAPDNAKAFADKVFKNEEEGRNKYCRTTDYEDGKPTFIREISIDDRFLAEDLRVRKETRFNDDGTSITVEFSQKRSDPTYTGPLLQEFTNEESGETRIGLLKNSENNRIYNPKGAKEQAVQAALNEFSQDNLDEALKNLQSHYRNSLNMSEEDAFRVSYFYVRDFYDNLDEKKKNNPEFQDYILNLRTYILNLGKKALDNGYSLDPIHAPTVKNYSMTSYNKDNTVNYDESRAYTGLRNKRNDQANTGNRVEALTAPDIALAGIPGREAQEAMFNSPVLQNQSSAELDPNTLTALELAQLRLKTAMHMAYTEATEFGRGEFEDRKADLIKAYVNEGSNATDAAKNAELYVNWLISDAKGNDQLTPNQLEGFKTYLDSPVTKYLEQLRSNEASAEEIDLFKAMAEHANGPEGSWFLPRYIDNSREVRAVTDGIQNLAQKYLDDGKAKTPEEALDKVNEFLKTASEEAGLKNSSYLKALNEFIAKTAKESGFDLKVPSTIKTDHIMSEATVNTEGDKIKPSKDVEAETTIETTTTTTTTTTTPAPQVEGTLADELRSVAWKTKFLDYEYKDAHTNDPNAKTSFAKCNLGSIKEVSASPQVVSMELSTEATLVNSANRINIQIKKDKQTTLEDTMTMVRLGLEKGWRDAKIDPAASLDFKRNMYIAMLAQGLEIKNQDAIEADLQQAGISIEELKAKAEELKPQTDKDKIKEVNTAYEKLPAETRSDVAAYDGYNAEQYKALKAGKEEVEIEVEEKTTEQKIVEAFKAENEGKLDAKQEKALLAMYALAINKDDNKAADLKAAYENAIKEAYPDNYGDAAAGMTEFLKKNKFIDDAQAAVLEPINKALKQAQEKIETKDVKIEIKSLKENDDDYSHDDDQLSPEEKRANDIKARLKAELFAEDIADNPKVAELVDAMVDIALDKSNPTDPKKLEAYKNIMIEVGTIDLGGKTSPTLLPLHHSYISYVSNKDFENYFESEEIQRIGTVSQDLDTKEANSQQTEQVVKNTPVNYSPNKDLREMFPPMQSMATVEYAFAQAALMLAHDPSEKNRETYLKRRQNLERYYAEKRSEAIDLNDVNDMDPYGSLQDRYKTVDKYLDDILSRKRKDGTTIFTEAEAQNVRKYEQELANGKPKEEVNVPNETKQALIEGQTMQNPDGTARPLTETEKALATAILEFAKNSDMDNYADQLQTQMDLLQGDLIKSQGIDATTAAGFVNNFMMKQLALAQTKGLLTKEDLQTLASKQGEMVLAIQGGGKAEGNGYAAQLQRLGELQNRTAEINATNPYQSQSSRSAPAFTPYKAPSQDEITRRALINQHGAFNPK
ncbi:MAG: hypothetical protein J5787_09840 [Alphaproteobacteria bacterium]|nr:hypothetical protein [Alphaproteobacteria bacterium]